MVQKVINGTSFVSANHILGMKGGSLKPAVLPIKPSADDSTTVVISNNSSATFQGFTVTRLREPNSAINYSTDTEIEVSFNAAAQRANTVGIASGISNLPSGAVITAAKIRLRLTFYDDAGAGSKVIEVREMLRSFTLADATWLMFTTPSLWTTAGALSNGNDRSATIAGTCTFTTTALERFIEISGAGLVSLCQQYLNSAGNYRFGFYDQSAVANGFSVFNSHNATDGFRPELWLTYTLPTGNVYATTLADSHASSDVYTLTSMTMNTSLADTVATSDSVSSLAVFAKTFADSHAVTDSVTSAAIFPKSYDDSHAVTDSFTGNIIFAVALADSIAATDVIDGVIAGVTYAVTLADSHAISDTISAGLLAIASLADSVATSDQYSALKITAAALADSHAVTDSNNAALIANVTLADSLTLTDTMTATKTLVALLADSHAMSDAISAGLLISAALTDSLAASDNISALSILTAALVDSVVLTDTTSALKVTNADLLDSHAVSDSISAARVMAVQLSDTTATSDIYSVVKTMTASLADTVVITDIYSAGSVFVVTLTDTNPISDAVIGQIVLLIFMDASIGRVAYAKRLNRIVYAEDVRVVTAAKN